jgi:serine/threonine-protein kinase
MSDEAPPRALVGAVIARRWRLGRVLGQGGIATVFEADGMGGEGQVAIKLLRPELSDEAAIVERFLMEAQTAARLQHPAITRVFDAGRAEDGTPYLVMELLRGRPLSALMDQGRLSVEQAVPIALRLLEALGAAHAAGVIHRDLKPDNVFMVQGASGAEVKILDFGLARVLDDASAAKRKTITGMLLGTPGYMSPEQIRNVKAVDLRADLWSMAILFYEMLTGQPAYRAENEFARITLVLTSDPTPIAEVAPQYAHWGAFFDRALHRDLAARFQSASEMANAIVAVSRSGQMPLADPQLRTIPLAVQPQSAPPPGPVRGDARTQPVSAMPEAPRFVGQATAISSAPAVASGGGTPAYPAVRVVSVSGAARVPLWVALALAGASMLLGFIAGWLAATL